MAKHDHSNGDDEESFSDDEESFSNQANRMIHGEEISLLEASELEATPISTSLLPGVIEEAQESDMAYLKRWRSRHLSTKRSFHAAYCQIGCSDKKVMRGNDANRSCKEVKVVTHAGGPIRCSGKKEVGKTDTQTVFEISVPEELPVLLCDLSHQELTVELKLRLEQFFHCGQMRGGCGVLVLQGLTSIGAWQTKEDIRTHNMKAKLKSFALDLTYFQSILEFKCSSEK
ncbi:hypothetical protein LINPERHAP1_LOCUS39524 [Linum perenne]